MGSGAADREAVEQQGRRDVLRLTKGQSIKFAYSSGVTGNIGPSSLRLASGGSTCGLAAVNRVDRGALLKKVKGVGTLIALTYILTLEDPRRS